MNPEGGEVIETIDGARLRVRPIEPEDADALQRAFGHLSERSRYRRFLAPVARLTNSTLKYLTELDHRHHEALIAITDAGEIVGVARYIRLEERVEVAEVAVTVVDDWQGRGVGTALLTRLATHAREAGVDAFLGICLAENQEMIQLLRELGGGARVTPEPDGTVEVEATLPDLVTAEDARSALRTAARANLGVARP